MTTYKQAFCLTMENGAVVLAVVMGEDPAHGEGLAIAEACELESCHVWDTSAYPTFPDLPEGVRRIFIA